ncbi:hypothetical protein GCM10027403_37800 [Arthrobacter tecti]
MQPDRLTIEPVSNGSPTKRRVLAPRVPHFVLAGVLLTVAACGKPGPPIAHADICNTNASWISTGRPTDFLSRAKRNITESLASAEEGAVPVAARSFLEAIETEDTDAMTVESEALWRSMH